MENKNIKNIDFKQFYDEFGNLKDEQNFEVIKYYKNSNKEWVEDERINSCGIYFIVNDKIYYRCNSLLEMNMDFNSKDCGACYQIGKSLKNNHKVIGNEILFTCNSNLEDGRVLKLHKQSYSDGTCFYTLENKRGEWNNNHGSKDIQDLINQMKLELEIDTEYSEKNYNKNNPKMKAVYDELKRWQQEIINNLEKVIK